MAGILSMADILSVFGLLLFGAFALLGVVFVNVAKDKILHIGRSDEARIRRYVAARERAQKAAVSHSKAPSLPKASARKKSASYIAMSAVLSEDRGSDWMACQLADEKKALRRNAADLGALHEASCAADDLKRSHRHDGTIDSGEIR